MIHGWARLFDENFVARPALLSGFKIGGAAVNEASEVVDVEAAEEADDSGSACEQYANPCMAELKSVDAGSARQNTLCMSPSCVDNTACIGEIHAMAVCMGHPIARQYKRTNDLNDLCSGAVPEQCQAQEKMLAMASCGSGSGMTGY
jgi:hypothetical protein